MPPRAAPSRTATAARASRHVRAGDEASDETAGGEERERDAAELRAAVILREGGQPDLGAAEADAEAPGEQDDRPHTRRLERPEHRAGMALSSGRQARTGWRERDERGADTARSIAATASASTGETRAREQGDEQRADHEEDLLQRCLERVRGRPPLGVREQARPERAERGADRRQQRPCRRGTARPVRRAEHRAGPVRNAPSRSAGKSTARWSRIRVWPRLSTSRPAIGAPSADATKYAPETAPAAA